MEFVAYIYGGQHATSEMRPFYCNRCKRTVFHHNSNRMVLSNAFGASLKEIKRGLKDKDGMPVFTEHKCHSCKSVYRIMFQ